MVFAVGSPQGSIDLARQICSLKETKISILAENELTFLRDLTWTISENDTFEFTEETRTFFSNIYAKLTGYEKAPFYKKISASCRCCTTANPEVEESFAQGITVLDIRCQELEEKIAQVARMGLSQQRITAIVSQFQPLEVISDQLGEETRVLTGVLFIAHQKRVPGKIIDAIFSSNSSLHERTAHLRREIDLIDNARASGLSEEVIITICERHGTFTSRVVALAAEIEKTMHPLEVESLSTIDDMENIEESAFYDLQSCIEWTVSKRLAQEARSGGRFVRRFSENRGEEAGTENLLDAELRSCIEGAKQRNIEQGTIDEICRTSTSTAEKIERFKKLLKVSELLQSAVNAGVPRNKIRGILLGLAEDLHIPALNFEIAFRENTELAGNIRIPCLTVDEICSESQLSLQDKIGHINWRTNFLLTAREAINYGISLERIQRLSRNYARDPVGLLTVLQREIALKRYLQETELPSENPLAAPLRRCSN